METIDISFCKDDSNIILECPKYYRNFFKKEEFSRREIIINYSRVNSDLVLINFQDHLSHSHDVYFERVSVLGVILQVTFGSSGPEITSARRLFQIYRCNGLSDSKFVYPDIKMGSKVSATMYNQKEVYHLITKSRHMKQDLPTKSYDLRKHASRVSKIHQTNISTKTFYNPSLEFPEIPRSKLTMPILEYFVSGDLIPNVDLKKKSVIYCTAVLSK